MFSYSLSAFRLLFFGYDKFIFIMFFLSRLNPDDKTFQRYDISLVAIHVNIFVFPFYPQRETTDSIFLIFVLACIEGARKRLFVEVLVLAMMIGIFVVFSSEKRVQCITNQQGNISRFLFTNLSLVITKVLKENTKMNFIRSRTRIMSLSRYFFDQGKASWNRAFSLRCVLSSCCSCLYKPLKPPTSLYL